MEFSWVARPSAAQASRTTTAAATARRPHNPAVTTQAIEDTICYLREYNVIVCKQHATAIQNLDAHIRQQHAITSQVRKQIVERYSGYGWIRDPQEIKLPAPLGPLIAELGEPLDGFQCAEVECDFLTINLDELRKHRKSAHRLAWNRKDSAAYQEVKVQTFFRGRALRRYFVVNAANVDSTLSVPSKVADIVKEHLAEWQQTQHAHKERAQVMDAHIAKTDQTGWF
jgi:hypothetical protein